MRPGDVLIRFFVPEHDETDRPEVRTRLAYLAAWVSIVGNVILAVFKVFLGLALNSLSLLADAAHTASDVLTSIIVIIGFRASVKPADRSHPFGHGRAESVAGLVIAVLLGVTAFEFASSGVSRLFHPQDVVGSWWAIVLTLLFALFKEWMARFSNAIGDRIGSETIHADAWHHRSDAITSLLVVIALVGAYFGITYLDALFGLFVAGVIGYVAFNIGMSATTTLLGKAAPIAFHDKIRRLARTITGVLGVHDVTVHQYGRHSVVNVHIETAANMPLLEAHEVASRVEKRISDELEASVVVHLEPAPQKGDGLVPSRIRRIIAETIRDIPGVVDFHGLNVYEQNGSGHIDLHVTLERTQDLASAHEVGHALSARIEAEVTGLAVNLHVEPCDGQCTSCRQPCPRGQEGDEQVGRP